MNTTIERKRWSNSEFTTQTRMRFSDSSYLYNQDTLQQYPTQNYITYTTETINARNSQKHPYVTLTGELFRVLWRNRSCYSGTAFYKTVLYYKYRRKRSNCASRDVKYVAGQDTWLSLSQIIACYFFSEQRVSKPVLIQHQMICLTNVSNPLRGKC